MKFRNNTPTGLFITASVRRSTAAKEGAVTVTMWGTRYWTVKSSSSDRYNVRKGGSLTDSGADCVPEPGSDGFDIDITRRIYRGRTWSTRRRTRPRQRRGCRQVYGLNRCTPSRWAPMWRDPTHTASTPARRDRRAAGRILRSAPVEEEL